MLKLSQLSPFDIQRLYAEMQQRGLSSRTVRYAHSVLSSALAQAVKWNLLIRNPAELVELPRQKRKEMKVLSAKELGQLFEAADGTREYPLWMLLAATGLRPGEALGLKWSDLREGRLHIQRALVRDLSGWRLEEPKTDRGRRSVVIPETLGRVLQQHRARQAEERLKAGGQYQNMDLIFASRAGLPVDYRVLVRRKFKPLLRREGLPDIRPYDLRHSHATVLLSAGVHPKIVSERLGHASVVITLDTYSHVLPDMQQSAADKVESLLFPSAVSAA